ncbi:MAG: hypothetical protein AAFX40_15630, partial [Cyanobacteria bacterium J06639_1]
TVDRDIENVDPLHAFSCPFTLRNPRPRTTRPLISSPEDPQRHRAQAHRHHNSASDAARARF